MSSLIQKYIMKTKLETFFFTTLIIIICAYGILYTILDMLDERFSNIKPRHKKLYVVKNYVKAISLAFISIYTPQIISSLINRDLKLDDFKLLAIIYLLNDFVPLLVFPLLGGVLPNTTIAHHMASTTIGMITLLKEDNTFDIPLLGLMYGYFSCLSFIVNFYLGYRVYKEPSYFSYITVKLSLWIYTISLMINWITQLYVLYYCFVFHWSYLMYFVFLLVVGNDDIKLIEWLKANLKEIRRKIE